jgi:hypothetical protein
MIDRHSKTWEIVSMQAENMLDAAMDNICQPGLSQDRTEFLRGRISVLNEILLLGEPATGEIQGSVSIY